MFLVGVEVVEYIGVVITGQIVCSQSLSQWVNFVPVQYLVTDLRRNLAGPGSYNHDEEVPLSSSNMINILRTTQLVRIRGYIDGRKGYSTTQLSNSTTLTTMRDSLEGPTPNRHLF